MYFVGAIVSASLSVCVAQCVCHGSHDRNTVTWVNIRDFGYFAPLGNNLSADGGGRQGVVVAVGGGHEVGGVHAGGIGDVGLPVGNGALA
eukprot:769558-Prorocentrum_minimum.AAC.1